MRMLYAVSISLLAGCASVDYAKVRYVPVAESDLATACPKLIGRNLGCVVFRGDIAEIRAVPPRDVRDSRAMEILGHEFYCHAWLKQSHTDTQGVRRAPWEDCKP